MLSNPIYVGEVRHGDHIYEGEHEAIIDREVFDAVQAKLAAGAPRPRGSPVNRDIHLLNGLLFDDTGDRLSPVHGKNKDKSKRYRHYISSRSKHGREENDSSWHIPAAEIEIIVLSQLKGLLADRSLLSTWIEQIGQARRVEGGLTQAESQLARLESIAPDHVRDVLRVVFRRIELHGDNIRFMIDHEAMAEWRINGDTTPNVRSQSRAADTSDLHIIDLPMIVGRRGVERRLVIEGVRSQQRSPDEPLVSTIARAHAYLDALTNGSGLDRRQVANRFQVHPEDVSRLIPLAFLSPRIVEAILTGQQPVDLCVRDLTRSIELPTDWAQ